MRRLILALAILIVAAPAFPAARLTYQLSNGNAVPVYWAPESFPLPYSVDRRVISSFPDAAASIDKAFAVWSSVPEANISFRNDGIVDGAKAGQDGKNTISMADGLFANQNFIALTTNWYDDDSGKMSEADIQIDSMIANTNYNIQQLVEHEVGHFLGLDHSAVISAVMYPYVGTGNATPLDSDDRIAIAGIYPRFDPNKGGTLQGKVQGDSGGIFAAQVVAVNESGEPIATGLTGQDGEFVLHGVPTGNYRIYAEPLDGPVDAQNLSGVWRRASVQSFPSRFVDGAAVHVDEGKIYGNLVVNSSGAPVQLNPKWIGVFTSGSSAVSLSSMTQTLKPGDSVSLAVSGDGFTSGMTTFEVLNPGLKRVSDFKWSTNYVYATFQVAQNAPLGSAVIVVKSGNDSAMLTGALRIASNAPRSRIATR